MTPAHIGALCESDLGSRAQGVAMSRQQYTPARLAEPAATAEALAKKGFNDKAVKITCKYGDMYMNARVVRDVFSLSIVCAFLAMLDQVR